MVWQYDKVMAVAGGRPSIALLFSARFPTVTYNIRHFAQSGVMSADTYVRPWYRFTGYGCDCYKQPKGCGPLDTREDDRCTRKKTH
jgi:hypothetical protein